MEFPRYVFKIPGKHSLGKGQTYDCALVEDASGLDEMLGSGWFQTVPEAMEPPQSAPPTEPDAPPTRAELEAKAIELGIRFDGRMGDKKLGALILEKLEA